MYPVSRRCIIHTYRLHGNIHSVRVHIVHVYARECYVGMHTTVTYPRAPHVDTHMHSIYATSIGILYTGYLHTTYLYALCTHIQCAHIRSARILTVYRYV